MTTTTASGPPTTAPDPALGTGLDTASSRSRSPEVASVLVDEAHRETCAACVHPRADHDDLGRRFCAATEVGAITRPCICRP